MATLKEIREARFLAEFEAQFPDAGPPSASTQSEGEVAPLSLEKASDAPTLLGTGGHAVIVGSKYDAKVVRSWIDGIEIGTYVLCGSPRVSKNGVPMNGEAILIDGGAEEIEWGEDYLGPKFRELQPGLIITEAIELDLTIWLMGTGKRIDGAKEYISRFGVGQVPPVLEL